MSKAGMICSLRLTVIAFVVVCIALPLIPVGYAEAQSAVTINNNSTVGASYYTVCLYTGTEDPGTGDMIYTPVSGAAFDEGEATYTNLNSSYFFGIEPVTLSIDDLYLGIHLLTADDQSTYRLTPTATTTAIGYNNTYTFTVDGNEVASGAYIDLDCTDSGQTVDFYFPITLSCVVRYDPESGIVPPAIGADIVLTVNRQTSSVISGDASVSVSQSSSTGTIEEQIEEHITEGQELEPIVEPSSGATEAFSVVTTDPEGQPTTDLVNESGYVDSSFTVPVGVPFVVKLTSTFNKPVHIRVGNTDLPAFKKDASPGYVYLNNGTPSLTQSFDTSKASPLIGSGQAVTVTVGSAHNGEGSVTVSIYIGPFSS